MRWVVGIWYTQATFSSPRSARLIWSSALYRQPRYEPEYVSQLPRLGVGLEQAVVSHLRREPMERPIVRNRNENVRIIRPSRVAA